MSSMSIEPRFAGTFTPEQTAQLLAPIKPHRVMTANGHSHVSQQDVIAHLTRVFGFGNWTTEILNLALVFERCREEKSTESHRERWDVCYQATMRLTVFDHKHNPVCWYEDGSMGDAQNQTRADGHDLAMKTAISTALKRCAKNLGDQFGLSLYNRGQQTALVGGTLIMPRRPEQPVPDLQDKASEQVDLGVDEQPIGTNPEATPEQQQMLEQSLGAEKIGEEPVSEEPPTDHTES